MRYLFLLLLICFPVLLFAENNPGYYRFPAVHHDTIVFTAEGDLWTVSISGGVAQRLTTHPGMESHPAISPDGKWVAFSAQYEGPTEVYLIPLSGGIPRRLTFDGRATVVGWTPKGKILYSTGKYSTLPNRQLVTLEPESEKETPVPLHQASDGMFSPDSKVLFFTRLPFQGSHTKRYKGGTAQNIWKYCTGDSEATPLTSDYPGTSKSPMWWQGRIYFISDRDGTMNIWSMKEDGSDVRQHTFHSGYDVGSASLFGGKIVYQRVADLYCYTIADDTDRKIDISLSSDFEQMREKWVKKPADYLTAAHISPKGDHLVLTARGQVFVAPVKQGRFVQATREKGVRHRNAVFMPDNESLLVQSDESGEIEFWKFPANGVGPAEQLSSDGKIFRFRGTPSPDGKWVAFTDKNNELWLLDVAKKSTRKLATSRYSNFYQLSWSPDSKWLACATYAANTSIQIKIFNALNGSSTAVTSDRVDSYSPAWSPDGKWLYFLSDRNFQSLVRSPWGHRQPEPFLDKTTRIYLLSLKKDQRFPFLPDDEIYLKKKNKPEEKKDASKKKEKKEKETVSVEIDFNSIANRIMQVPVPAGNYHDFSVNKDYLFWLESETGLQGKQALKFLKIGNEKIKAKTVTDGLSGYELSADGKKLLIQKKNDFYVIDASGAENAKLTDKKVDLSEWTFPVNPKDEWKQMFLEAWRLERDYFYDPNLHGVDYSGTLNRYLPFVSRVTNRDELGDLISNMVGELSALHIFVTGGDKRKGEDNIKQGSLGAVLTRDEEFRGYRIEHIYQSDPDYLDHQSPLTKPGLTIQEGDIITHINGTSLQAVQNPMILLENQVAKQVLLTLRSHRSNKEYQAVVKPISLKQEKNLRYDEWEYQRRMIVEKESNREIGYVHLQAMGGDNYSEWVRNFYPVFNRKGLIIDVRHNRGGNIDSWILEKLMRKAWFYWKSRTEEPTWNMQYAFRGHMVVICDEFTASDGEAFTEGFRRLGLGKVIGTRTWGGEIWLSFDNYLVDKGIASAAETGVYGPKGKWLIEGHGVDPDIIVDNLPHATFKGKDAQLEAAIQYLQKKIKDEPVTVPPPPPFPNKSFDYPKK